MVLDRPRVVPGKTGLGQSVVLLDAHNHCVAIVTLRDFIRRFIDFGIFESGDDGHELEKFGTLDAIIYSKAGESSLQTYSDGISGAYIADYEWALEKAKNLVVLEKLASKVKGIQKN